MIHEMYKTYTLSFAKLHWSVHKRLSHVSLLAIIIFTKFEVGQPIRSWLITFYCRYVTSRCDLDLGFFCDCSVSAVTWSISVLWALSRSHFLIDFHQNWHGRKNPQKEERVRWGEGGVNIAPPVPLFWPQSPHFRPRCSKNPCKY